MARRLVLASDRRATARRRARGASDPCHDAMITAPDEVAALLTV
jgi:hypothetical protein